MNGLFDLLAGSRVYVVGALTVLLAGIASGHAILYKRDSRAAVGWVGLIVLAPIVGPLLYAILGINRIRRHASELRAATLRLSGPHTVVRRADAALAGCLSDEAHHLIALGRLVDRVSRRPLTTGNRVRAFIDGDEAFPAMLEAIGRAERSVALSTYIFDRDSSGQQFAEALAGAVRRGVDVRVLIDGVGSRYSFPSMVRALKKLGIRVARFMPTYVPWRAPFWNLRNHRKILVTDGRFGFTGGMNIRRGHVRSFDPVRVVQDMHFAVDGPVVQQCMETFAEDWAFTTGELLEGPDWFPEIEPAGTIVARGITDGPDEDFEKLRWTIHGAIATARHSVHVMTPYFLPDDAMVTALNVAALRGVTIQVVLPAVNNLPIVHWASRALLWQLVKRSCEVYYTPPPFDHTKLFIVDGTWTLFGSANWDPRSLRLNFEFNVECYDATFAAQMESIFADKRDAGRRVTPAELDGRSLPVRLRDGVARLLTPYL